ncbi:MAG TPA: GTPase ObgE [Candidatus Omnitrophota bacterium]|nr:GTPase ObgE [Candidatus Omnitrophota bacterium]
MLIDQAKIYVEGGGGGKGCRSFFKDIFHRKGIPDGGPGGRGGDVVFKADQNLHTLLDFRYNQHYKAERGGHGGSNHKFGRQGRDLVVKVPAGTVLVDAATSLVIKDLAFPGESVLVARGGNGGRGNSKNFEATEGEPGESKTILLELKLVADAGIIGLPNAGKSTLVSRISRSHSKIAPYPFTTKSPKLGVVSVGGESFVAADMPGLIEGAHGGKGLGDRFLRHIERTSVLVHVVDIMPFDGSDPAANYELLERELKLYAEDVFNKPRVVVANKMDISGASESLERFVKKVPVEVYPISGVTGEGIKELIPAIHRKIKDAKREKSETDNGESGDESPYGG